MPLRRNYRPKRRRAVRRRRPTTGMVSRPRFARRRRYARSRIPRNYLTRDQTITMTLETPDQEQAYLPVDASHLDLLSSTITTSTTSLELSRILVECVGFRDYTSMFRWMRVSRIKVKLIPETWTASTTVGNADPNLTDGEKPSIHWINDDGSVGSVTGSPNLSIPIADSYGKLVKKERLFTKPMTFSIKPYYRTTGTDAQLASPKYISSNQWRAVVSNSIVKGLVVPERNFYFGFTNVPDGFKYKTVVEFTVTFKQPYVIPAP